MLIIAVLLLILVLAIEPARELLFGIDAYVIRWTRRKFKRLRRQTKGALLVLAAVLTGILIILGIVF